MRSSIKLLCAIVSVLWIAAVIPGCVSTPPATQSPPEPGEVRQPAGNPESFWGKFSWSELSAAEQRLWGKLGWDRDSWDGASAPPASEEMEWGQLSPEERAAATKLGYDRFYWDSN